MASCQLIEKSCTLRIMLSTQVECVSLAYDYLHPGNEQGAVDQISKIGMRLTGIFHLTREQSLPTNEIADRLAQQRSVKRGGHTTNVA